MYSLWSKDPLIVFEVVGEISLENVNRVLQRCIDEWNEDKRAFIEFGMDRSLEKDEICRVVHSTVCRPRGPGLVKGKLV